MNFKPFYIGLLAFAAIQSYVLTRPNQIDEVDILKANITQSMKRDAGDHLEQALAFADSMNAVDEGIFQAMHGSYTGDRNHLTFVHTNSETEYMRLDSLYHQAREKADAIIDSLNQGKIRGQ